MSKAFNISQFEEHSPIRVEGESSQEKLSNQEADQDQVDLYLTLRLFHTNLV